ncbi:MAG TPA: hypothetical protein DD761_08935 [Cyanobacteria bacterium UBA11691]|nr:hypothetical protein [Cyanobacteria bacterium UBA11691]
MKDKIRLVLINLFVTHTIIMSLNLLSIIVLFVSGEMKGLPSREQADEKWDQMRANLPNYDDHNRELIELHFREYRQQKPLYQSYIGWSLKPFKGKTINIDNNGDRIHEGISVDKSNKSVYFFGGSTLWGEGAPDSETIPALFSFISGFPSYNKGDLGLNSRQGVARLINLLSQGEKIDFAIFYDGVNDVAAGCLAGLRENDHYNASIYRERIEKGRKSLKNDTLKLYLNGSEFVQALDWALFFGTRNLAAKINQKIFNRSTVENSVDDFYVCDNSSERAQRVAESIVNHWEIAQKIAEDYDIDFLAILQPVAHVGSANLTQITFNELQQEEALQYRTVYPLIKESMQKRGHKWIVDYTEMFSRDKYIYIDFCHVSPNGNLIIAEQIYKDIKSYLE